MLQSSPESFDDVEMYSYDLSRFSYYELSHGWFSKYDMICMWDVTLLI